MIVDELLPDHVYGELKIEVRIPSWFDTSNPASVRKFKNLLIEFQKELPERKRKVLEEMGQEAKTVMHDYIIAYSNDITSKNLAKTLQIDYYPNAFILYPTAEYWDFVEFGTGVKGEHSPHPNQIEGWNYNVGKSINDDGTWEFPNPRFGFHKEITSGQVGKQYIYKTQKYINENLPAKIERIIYGE